MTQAHKVRRVSKALEVKLALLALKVKLARKVQPVMALVTWANSNQENIRGARARFDAN